MVSAPKEGEPRADVPQPDIQNDPHSWTSYNEMSVGQVLTRAREHYGLTVDDVSLSLRIRASYIQALEDDDVSVLPGRVYAIGFIRSYAEFLGLDGDKIIYLFKTHTLGNAARPELNFPLPASESKLPNIYTLIGSFVALAIIFTAFSILSDAGDAPQIIPPANISNLKITPYSEAMVFGPPMIDTDMNAKIDEMNLNTITDNAEDALAVTDIVENVIKDMDVKDTDQVIQETEPAEEARSSRVTITVLQESWIEIKNSESGKVITAKLLKPGDKYNVPPEDSLVLNSGNVGGLVFIVDGERLGVLGKKGEVVRNMKLGADDLKKVETMPENMPIKSTVKRTNKNYNE